MFWHKFTCYFFLREVKILLLSCTVFIRNGQRRQTSSICIKRKLFMPLRNKRPQRGTAWPTHSSSSFLLLCEQKLVTLFLFFPVLSCLCLLVLGPVPDDLCFLFFWTQSVNFFSFLLRLFFLPDDFFFTFIWFRWLECKFCVHFTHSLALYRPLLLLHWGAQKQMWKV